MTATAFQMSDLIGVAIDDAGLSQAEFCRRVSTSQKHLSMVLNGHAVAATSTLDYWAWSLDRHFEVRLKKGTAA